MRTEESKIAERSNYGSGSGASSGCARSKLQGFNGLQRRAGSGAGTGKRWERPRFWTACAAQNSTPPPSALRGSLPPFALPRDHRAHEHETNFTLGTEKRCTLARTPLELWRMSAQLGGFFIYSLTSRQGSLSLVVSFNPRQPGGGLPSQAPRGFRRGVGCLRGQRECVEHRHQQELWRGDSQSCQGCMRSSNCRLTPSG